MSVLQLRTWTLRRRVTALVAVVALVLAALGVFAAITAAESNDNLDTVLNKTGPMRIAGETLVTALVDQETGIRGYAISGKQENLEPYEQGVAQERQLLATIEQQEADFDDPALRAAIQEVRQAAESWRTRVAEPVLNAVQTQGPETAVALVDAAATAQFDAVRAAIERLQNEILKVRNAAANAATQTGSTLVAIQVAAAAIIVLAGVVLLLLIDRLVSQPVVELAEQVREVAKGDYDRRITSAGSPELRTLAADVDGMRKQIAAELTEVREARAQVEWINDQLKVQAEELVRSNRDLEQFAYVASHDLQEPLRKVASFCQLLQRRYAGQMDERADQYIAFAVDGAQRMQRLINDLLAFSRIGRLTSGFTEVDLDHVLSGVKAHLEARTGDDGEIVWHDLPTVEGEEPLLTTLFMNLIGNALKFRRPDVPPRVEITAELIGTEQAGEEWHIVVRDNGIGIEREFADKVFVIFQRLHARDAYEGTGIGLAIVKKIVEYHGGRIWLDLDVDEGTSINFTLPVLAGVPVTEPPKEVAAP
jgi:signal transduction histidine kinase